MAFEPPERMLAFLRSPVEAEDRERDYFWTLFYRSFRSHYERMAMRDYRLNQEDAEDVVMMTMAKVDKIMRRPMISFPSLAKFHAFFRLKLNQTILDLKKRQKRANEILAQVSQTDVEQVADPSEIDPSKIDPVVDAQEKAMADCIQRLNELERKLFNLVMIEGRTQAEVARVLELPPKEVSRVLGKANKKIWDCLSDRGWTPT